MCCCDVIYNIIFLCLKDSANGKGRDYYVIFFGFSIS